MNKIHKYTPIINYKKPSFKGVKGWFWLWQPKAIVIEPRKLDIKA